VLQCISSKIIAADQRLSAKRERCQVQSPEQLKLIAEVSRSCVESERSFSSLVAQFCLLNNHRAVPHLLPRTLPHHSLPNTPHHSHPCFRCPITGTNSSASSLTSARSRFISRHQPRHFLHQRWPQLFPGV
jgi:hypothetical protein